jgi:1-acyl-sn-glycerol-3-phosphate acyltransferase|tara:strand:- start:1798 stop:2499 length:702 start_codon:yes stop_codon:yes gene_type:complete
MIRNLFFSIFFYIGIVLVCLIFLPAFFLPQKIVLFGGKIMGFWSRFCLEFFLSTKIVIKGRENIISNEKFFIACSHQSMFETFYLQTLFNSPIFILKKELLSIPIFGWYLKKIKSISIDRNKINKENLDFYEKIKLSSTSTDRPIIIFPQATRVAFDDRSQFKKGASRIYESLNIKCQPVAINSGTVWPKSGKLIANKTLTISILKSIEAGMNSKEFLEVLQNSIYKELDSIS